MPRLVQPLEARRLFAAEWSAYADLVNQDDAAFEYADLTGAGQTVAVIDTGVNYELDVLGGGFGAGYKVVAGYDFLDDDADPMDEDGHGTAVAAVVAADEYTVDDVRYRGVAPDAQIAALRVGDEDGITDANIEQALQWVLDHRDEHNITVVNLSLGSGSYADENDGGAYADEFAQLRAAGVLVVAASGNSNDAASGPIESDGIANPASDPNVFAVGAVSSADVIPTWSQRGDELDLLAPGQGIVVPSLTAGDYDSVDGTSFSAPMVAGAAVLVNQLTPSASAGDLGSILMASGAFERDGDDETGNTTTHGYSRLDLLAALQLAPSRAATAETIDLGRQFSTALDSQGVLHAAFYTTGSDGGALAYATRSTAGLWSQVQIVDGNGGADVGAQPSLAVDPTGKAAAAYFDLNNTAVKFALFDGAGWDTSTVDSRKHVGEWPSLQFDIDGNAYLAYYRRSAGMLKLATLDRDSGAWSVDIADDAGNVGQFANLDVGEAPYTSSFGFTRYNTTLAIAYADADNGDLKYTRLDLDDTTATWYSAVVDDTDGVAHIDLNLHAGPLGDDVLQAQIAYQDVSGADVKYAYRDTTWFTETVAGANGGDAVGDELSIYFDAANTPVVAYYNRSKKALYTGTRTGSAAWSTARVATSSGPLALAMNERTDEAYLAWLNRPRTAVYAQLVVA